MFFWRVWQRAVSPSPAPSHVAAPFPGLPSASAAGASTPVSVRANTHSLSHTQSAKEWAYRSVTMHALQIS